MNQARKMEGRDSKMVPHKKTGPHDDGVRRWKMSLASLPRLMALATLCGLCHVLPGGSQQVAPQPPSLMVLGPPAPAPGYPRPPNPVVIIPGNEGLLRQAERVDQIILPHENYLANLTGSQRQDYRTSYVIDHKRYVEPYSSRCFATTLIEDPDGVEPQFAIIRPGSELRVNATAPVPVIAAAGFDPKLRTTIVVHGFTQSYPGTEWLRQVRALYEMHQLLPRENLIIMDWGSASKGAYNQVAGSASGMGSFLANFLMKLLDMGLERRALHLIGHSLGAHVAGFAGKRIRPHLGRITALDPAGPCFGKIFSNSANDRLSSDDAIQVDVFHYDDDFLGLSTPLGHFDVYVNGGSSQPGAVDNMNAMVQALITMVFRRNRVLSESHSRSTEVATADLARTGCQQVAYECRDWPAFMSGECGLCDRDNAQCFLMSQHYQHVNMEPLPLRQSPGKRLYVATSASSLFCLHHFQILVKFDSKVADLVTQAQRNKWRLQLELVNERNEHANVTLIHQMAPGTFSYLLLSEMAPTRFRAATLQVRSGLDNSLVPLRDKSPFKAQSRPYGAQAVRVQSVEINFMSSVDPRARFGLSSRLCPSGWLSAGSPNSIPDSSANGADEWLQLADCTGR